MKSQIRKKKNGGIVELLIPTFFQKKLLMRGQKPFYGKKLSLLKKSFLLKPHKQRSLNQFFLLDLFLFTLLIFLLICKWQLNEHWLFLTLP